MRSAATNILEEIAASASDEGGSMGTGAGALGEMPLSASGLTRADHCIDDITCKLWSPLRSLALLEHAFVHERLENLARVSGNVS